MEEIYLITGVTGFLGYMVAKKLLEQGKKVVGLRLPGWACYNRDKSEET